jgi:CBS domain-containing protein
MKGSPQDLVWLAAFVATQAKRAAPESATRNKADYQGFPVKLSGSFGPLPFAQRMSRQQGGKSVLVREMMRKTVSVQAEETLEVAALRLKQENVGALPVVEADQVAGMITDRDILLRGPAGGRSITRTKARDVMSVGAVACHDKDDLDHALGLMSRNRIHRLPVLGDDEKLVGVLSLNQFRMPSSEPAAFEVVFYKQIPNSTGHVYNVELTKVAIARGFSKTEAVQAAIKKFEKERKAASWDLVADGYDVLEHEAKPLQTERIRQRAYELWEEEGRPDGRQEEHWARACREMQMEDQ